MSQSLKWCWIRPVNHGSRPSSHAEGFPRNAALCRDAVRKFCPVWIFCSDEAYFLKFVKPRTIDGRGACGTASERSSNSGRQSATDKAKSLVNFTADFTNLGDKKETSRRWKSQGGRKQPIQALCGGALPCRWNRCFRRWFGSGDFAA